MFFACFSDHFTMFLFQGLVLLVDFCYCTVFSPKAGGHEPEFFERRLDHSLGPQCLGTIEEILTVLRTAGDCFFNGF